MARFLQLFSKATPVVAATLTLAMVEMAPVFAQQTGQNSSQNNYPSEFVSGFLERCTNAATNRGIAEDAARSSCECMISQFQKNYSYEDYLTLAQNIAQRQVNRQQAQRFFQVIRPCVGRQ